MLQIGHWVVYRDSRDYTLGIIIDVVNGLYTVQWVDGVTLPGYGSKALVKA